MSKNDSILLMHIKQKKYFENLDGLRFIAFLSVFAGHCFHFLGYHVKSKIATRVVGHFFLHADLGVSFFFVLSGFLISYLLLTEKQVTKTISIRNFFLRRLLRIWPVYFVVICLGFFILPMLLKSVRPELLPFSPEVPLSQLPWYCLFIVNFELVAHGANFLTVCALWSVSVEEQYYLIWPLITKVTAKYSLLIVLCLLIFLSFLYRWNEYENPLKLRHATLSVLNNLAIGALCAWLIVFSKKFKHRIARVKKKYIRGLYLLLAICIPLRGFIYYFNNTIDQILVTTTPLLFSVLFAFVILEQNFCKNSVFKISKFKLFSRLGTISYGLYCYHMVCILLTGFAFRLLFGNNVINSPLMFIFQITVSFTLTVFISHISYKYMEARLLQLKGKFAS